MTYKSLNQGYYITVKDLPFIDDGFILESSDIDHIFKWSELKGFHQQNVFQQYTKVLEEVSELILGQEDLLSLSLRPTVFNALSDLIASPDCNDLDVYLDILDSVGDILIALMILYQQVFYNSNTLDDDPALSRHHLHTDMERIFSFVHSECMNICIDTLDEQDLMIDFLKDVSFLANDVISANLSYVSSSIMSIFVSLSLISIYYGFTLKMAFDFAYTKLLGREDL